jgi:hypothetical protein
MENILLNLINKKEYELIGEGYISKSYRFILNSKKYILLQGQLFDSFPCYNQSYNNIMFLFNKGKSYIKSVKIPDKGIELIKPNEKNNFLKNGALIYEEIEGFIFYKKYFNKINKENISNKLSLFLNELYIIPINNNDIPQAKNKIISEFNDDIKTINSHFKGNNMGKINNFKEEFLEYIKDFNDFHYIHGDLWEENMIISYDYQDLIGIVDFDNFSLGDIAKDYAALLDLGFDFIDMLLNKNIKCYKNKEEFVKRIKIYQKKIEIEDLAYILRDNNLKWRINSKMENLKELCLI